MAPTWDNFIKEYVDVYHRLEASDNRQQLRLYHARLDEILEDVQLYALVKFTEEVRKAMDTDSI